MYEPHETDDSSYLVALESEQDAFKFVSAYRDVCGFKILRNGQEVFYNKQPVGGFYD